MSVRHIEVRGLSIPVGSCDVRSSNGTVHHYLRARIPQGRDPVTHKARPAKQITAKTEPELRQKILANIDVRVQLGGIPQSRVTVEEWVGLYLERYLRGAPSTQSKARHICRGYIVPRLGQVCLQELTELQVEDFRDYLLEERGLGPNTVRDIISLLNVILDRAVHSRVIPFNPATMVKKPRRVRPKRVVLTGDQIRAFLREAEQDRYGNMLGLMLVTGLRIGEALGLEASRVDFDGARITVDHHVMMMETDSGWAPQLLPSTKSGVNRTISVPKQALAYVRAELETRDARALAAGEEWHNEHDLVFANDRGGIIHRETVMHHLKAIGARIGRPDITPHLLRHTAATVLYQQSHNVVLVRDMLGHQSVATTERYIHTTEEDLRVVAKA